MTDRDETPTEQHERPELVAVAHPFALFGHWLLGLAITVVVLLIVDVTEGATAGIVAASVVLVVIVGLWGLLPGWLRRVGAREPAPGGTTS
jgi:TRAP-type mannitol/chloroaromatic compound transport system permease large subunit